MQEGLMLKLIEKGIVRTETQIKAKITTVDISGQTPTEVEDLFAIKKITSSASGLTLHVQRLFDAKFHKVTLSQVSEIEGMPINRLVQVYNLHENGVAKIEKLDTLTGLPVRRGRKPNHIKKLMEDLKAAG